MTRGGAWLGRGEDAACERLDRGTDESLVCPAFGCEAPVPKGKWCGRHWRMIPRRLQLRIYHAKTPEQRAGAIAEARDAVERAEFGGRLL